MAVTPKKQTDRIETFEAVKPDGSVVRITRNIDTGEQEVAEVTNKQ